MTFSNIPDELISQTRNGKVMFQIEGISTNLMEEDDPFIERIDENNLNQFFLIKHLIKEIEVKNLLDDALTFLNDAKFKKAIEKLDEVIYYDPFYGQALMYKSHALFGQKHFVKSLRYYKRAVKTDNSLKDIEYHKLLLNEANNERSVFPKLKLNIYSGDEYFAEGEFEKAVESYNRALSNPSKFKEKILPKLLNKKGCALVKLEKFNEALECFKQFDNDFACFGEGFCEYKLDLKVNDGFKELLKLAKKFQLKQALILNELGVFEKSLEISDYLFKNHFKVDDFYLELLSVRKNSMKELGMDLSEIEEIFNQINE